LLVEIGTKPVEFFGIAKVLRCDDFVVFLVNAL